MRGDDGSTREGRWRGHPIAGRLILLVAYLFPVGAGLATAIGVATLIPRPAGGSTVEWWLPVLGGSMLVIWLTERLARRLIPLAALLKLTLVFPDRAPSRYRVARVAGNTRLLERRVREAKAHGVSDDPTVAAEMVLSLVAAIGAHDRRTRGHSERVRAFVDMLGDELDLPPEGRVRLRWAALLHDLGKLQVEAEILNKAGKLSGDEWEAIRAHPGAGARLAGPLLPWLGEWGRAIPEHHERYDGTGYPAGHQGEEISLAGRITAIADAFETMTAARAYKKPMSPMAARRELVRCADTQFDPALVRAFLSISLGRVIWTVGPLAWISQIPLVSRLAGLRSGEGSLAAAKSAAVTKTLAGIVALGMTGSIVSSDAPASDPSAIGGAPSLVRLAAAPSDLGIRNSLAGTSEEQARRARDRDRRASDRANRGSDDETRSSDRSDGGPSGSGSAPSGGDGGAGGGSGSVVGSVQETGNDTVDAVGGVVDSVTGEVEEVVDDVGKVIDGATGSLPSLPGS